MPNRIPVATEPKSIVIRMGMLEYPHPLDELTKSPCVLYSWTWTRKMLCDRSQCSVVDTAMNGMLY